MIIIWKRMEIPTRNELLQDLQDIVFQESAHQETLFSYYHQCFQQPQDFNTLVSAGAISHIPERIMQVGFSSAPSKRRKTVAAADIIQVHDGGGRVIRSGGGRKDRHTKVSTSRGITRDRRVRLSPKTAIQFYDVQDRLGYDRPSKAIDWLMKEAKSAIDALHLHAPPPPLPIIDNFIDTNCFAENHRDGFDCFSSTNNGVAAPFSYSSSSSEFQVFPFVDGTPEEYSIVDPRYDHEPFFTLNYARDDDYDNNSSSVVRSLPLHFPDREMLSQREPLQSIYPVITANHSPPFPGITFSNTDDQELLPNFTATNSLLHFQEL